MSVDNFDLAILKVLQEDARASLQVISERVGLSSTPCWARIKRMENEGVIQGYTVRVDPSSIGLSETVIVQVTLESHTDETLYDFGKMLEQIPEVMEAYLVSGDYDYYIRIAVKDTRDYERLLRERLYRIPGIRHSKSSFVLRTLKESLIPLSAASAAGSVAETRKAGKKKIAGPKALDERGSFRFRRRHRTHACLGAGRCAHRQPRSQHHRIAVRTWNW